MADESKNYIKYLTLSRIPEDALVEYITKEEVLDIIKKLEVRIAQLEKLVYTKGKLNEEEKSVEENEKKIVESDSKKEETERLFRRARRYENINTTESIKCYKMAAANGHSKAIMKCVTNGWSY